MSQRILSTIFLTIASLAIIAEIALADNEVLLRYNFSKGCVSVYDGTIEITDIGGIPTDAHYYGDESKALTSYTFSIPFTYKEEVVDVDKAGTATVRSTRDIDINNYTSHGRDQASVKTVKACLDFFKLLRHSQWTTSIKRNGGISDVLEGSIYDGQDLPIFPDGPVKIGDRQQKIVETQTGVPVEISWELKDLKDNKNQQKIASINMIRKINRTEPSKDVYIQRTTESSTNIDFNVGTSIIQNFQFSDRIETKLIDTKGNVLSGRSMGRVKLIMTQRVK